MPYTYCVPKTEYRQVPVTTCELRTTQHEEHYTEMVPHPVQKQIQVQVCHMVQKQIQVPVCQPCCPTPCCEPCRSRCRGCGRCGGGC